MSSKDKLIEFLKSTNQSFDTLFDSTDVIISVEVDGSFIDYKFDSLGDYKETEVF